MELRPGAENRQKREWLRRESHAGPAREALVAPFKQFFATSPVACPYVSGRAERKLIVELGGSGAALFYDDLSRALQPYPLDEAHPQHQSRHLRAPRRRPRHTRAIPALLRLSALAAQRQRHGIDELWRLPGNGRGHPGADSDRRVSRRARTARRSLADRFAR